MVQVDLAQALLPLVADFLCVVWFKLRARCSSRNPADGVVPWFPIPSTGANQPTALGRAFNPTQYGSINDNDAALESAGTGYGGHWASSFDGWFLRAMAASLSLLCGLTAAYEPTLWADATFWAVCVCAQPAAFMAWAFVCGLLTR